MNAKMIEALKGISENINILIDEAEKSSVTTGEKSTPAKTEKSEPKTIAPKGNSNVVPMSRKEKEESEELPDLTGNLDEEQLNALSYNNLKKLAKEMGIPATGAREELTQKILNTEVSAPVEEEAPVEEKSTKKTPRKLGKKSEPVDEPEPEEEIDPIVEQVNEAVAEMTDEEILDTLADVGVKAKGKRQALIAAVIKAVKDGKIDLDSDDDESGEEISAPADDDSDDGEEVDPNDTEDMTDERRTAIEEFDSEARNDFEEGTITRKDMIEWLNEFHQTKETMKKKSDEDLLDEYIYCSCLLINDEGEMPEEEGAYTVNGTPYCCGHELSLNDDNATYICETCGGEYEAGE